MSKRSYTVGDLDVTVYPDYILIEQGDRHIRISNDGTLTELIDILELPHND